MADEVTEDPGGTVDATTEEGDTVAWSTATEAIYPVDTATETWTTPEAGRTAPLTDNPKAGGTPGDRLETGRTGGGTIAAMAGALSTAIMTPEEVDTTVWSPEDG